MSFQIRSSDIKQINPPAIHPVPNTESPVVEKAAAPFSTITGAHGDLLRALFERGIINEKGQLLKPVDLPPLTPPMIAVLQECLLTLNRFEIEGAEVEKTVQQLINSIDGNEKSNFIGQSVLAMLFDEQYGYLALLFKNLGIEDLLKYVQGKSWVKKPSEITIKTRFNDRNFKATFEKLKTGLELPGTAFENINLNKPFFQLQLSTANVRWMWELVIPRPSIFNLDKPVIPLANLYSRESYPVNQDDPTKKPFNAQNIFDILFGCVDIEDLNHIDAAAWQWLCLYYTQGYTNKTEDLERKLFEYAFQQVSYFGAPLAQLTSLFDQFKRWASTKTTQNSNEYWALLFNAYVFLNQFESDLTITLPPIESKNPVVSHLSTLLSQLPLRKVLAFLDVFTNLALTNKSKLVEETHQGFNEPIYQIRLDEHTVLRWKPDLEKSQKLLLETPIDDLLSDELETLLSLFFEEISPQQSAQHLAVFTSATEWVHSESHFFKLLGFLCLDQGKTSSAEIYLQTYCGLVAQVKSPQLKQLLKTKMESVFNQQMPREISFSRDWIAILLRLRKQFPCCETLLCNILQTSPQEADRQQIISSIPSMCLAYPSFVRRLLTVSEDNLSLVEICISLLEQQNLSPEQSELFTFLTKKQHDLTPKDNESPPSVSQPQEVQTVTKQEPVQEAAEFFTLCNDLLQKKKPEQTAELLLVEKAEFVNRLLNDAQFIELFPQLNAIFIRIFRELIKKCENVFKNPGKKSLYVLPQLLATARSFLLKYHAYFRNEFRGELLSLFNLSGHTLVKDPDSFLAFWKSTEELNLFPVESKSRPLSIALVFFLQRNTPAFIENFTNQDINSIFGERIKEAIYLFEALISTPTNPELKELIINKYLLFRNFAVTRPGIPRYRTALNQGETFLQLQKEGQIFIHPRFSIRDFINDNGEFDLEGTLAALGNGSIGIAEKTDLLFFESYESIGIYTIKFYLENQNTFEAIREMRYFINLARSQNCFKDMEFVFEEFIKLTPILVSEPFPRNQPQLNHFLLILDTLMTQASIGDMTDLDYLNIARAFLICAKELTTGEPVFRQTCVMNAAATVSLGYQSHKIRTQPTTWRLFKDIFTGLLKYPYLEVAKDTNSLLGLTLTHIRETLPKEDQIDFLNTITQVENQMVAYYRGVPAAISVGTATLLYKLGIFIHTLLLENFGNPDIARPFLEHQHVTIFLTVNLCDKKQKPLRKEELDKEWELLETTLAIYNLAEQSYLWKTRFLEAVLSSTYPTLSAANRTLIHKFAQPRLLNLIQTYGTDAANKLPLTDLLRGFQAIKP